MSDGPVQNTDRELWREREGDYYADSIHVTASGGIGINVGGSVYVMPLRSWHKLAQVNADLRDEIDALRERVEHYERIIGEPLVGEITQLRAEVSTLRADAERWRELRKTFDEFLAKRPKALAVVVDTSDYMKIIGDAALASITPPELPGSCKHPELNCDRACQNPGPACWELTPPEGQT